MNSISAASESLLPQGPLSQLIDMGGPVMVVLIALAVIGLVTFFYLMLFGAFYTPRFSRKLRHLLNQWQADPASARPQEVQQQAGFLGRTNPLLHLLTNTMQDCQRSTNIPAVRETAVRDAQNALEPFEAPLKIIEVIAALAPLLGLLGTVMGMMEAFSAMAATEGRANATQLSGGIYEALATTAAGLVVAIPFAALAAWIEFRLRRIHKNINGALVSVFNVTPLTSTETAQPAPAPAAHRESSPEPDSNYSVTSSPRFAHAAG
ncbi:outer membrane transport energization protein ExbB [Marinobacter persicus]|uniref:Outer membrane transport energization protein ExbB n=1 Tax=Marinobacter persicus TaxID=930118 RepID=A0A1I3SL18_9GAMM|nr:MotA/TolQ/ExbB proton channel family protein [Marinobacter persicus]SFJ59435.1 outer membrane transport energization protein ExbB [Marinobacter persicus]